MQFTEACEEEEPQSYTPIYVPKPNVDTETRVVDEAKQQSISGDNKNNRKICGDIKVNSYYDEGNFERSQCTILHILRCYECIILGSSGIWSDRSWSLSWRIIRLN